MVELELEFRLFDSQTSALSKIPELFDTRCFNRWRTRETKPCIMVLHYLSKPLMRELGPRKNRSGCNLQFERVGVSFSEAPRPVGGVSCHAHF